MRESLNGAYSDVLSSDFLTGRHVAPGDVKLHCLVISALAVALLLGVLASPAAAQEPACDAVLDNATNATGGPGGQLADAIGDQGSDIGSELNDRWFDARLANATSNASRADIIAAEVNRIEARLNRTEACWRAAGTGGGGNVASELTPRQVEALERQALSLHRRINETQDHAAALSPDLREQRDIGPERIAALERRVVGLRESLAERDADT